jgi:hypothetical protein
MACKHCTHPAICESHGCGNELLRDALSAPRLWPFPPRLPAHEPPPVTKRDTAVPKPAYPNAPQAPF